MVSTVQFQKFEKNFHSVHVYRVTTYKVEVLEGKVQNEQKMF